MKRLNISIVLTAAVLIAGVQPCLEAVWYEGVYKSCRERINKVDPMVGTIAAVTAGCAALAGVIWWIATDRRSDEQVIADSQRLINSTHHKYDSMVQLITTAHMANYAVLDEQLLCNLSDRGVDSYYLRYVHQTVQKITSEMNALSHRIERSKVESASKRMKVTHAELQQLHQFIMPLQQVLDYHAPYMQLYRTVTQLQRIYAQPCGFKTSQKKLLQYVSSQSSSFAAYPYFEYIENLERVVQRIKSELSQASYAHDSQVYRSAHDLYEALLVVKGTLASTTEYREDIQKRERALIKMQQEQERLVRKLARQQAEEAARRERERIEEERERLAREKQKLEHQRQQREREIQLQQSARQREELERMQQAQVKADRQRQEQERAQRQAYQQQQQYEQQLKAWQEQQAQWEDEQRRQQAYQHTNAYPSAPDFDAPENPMHQMPEPSAPAFEENLNQQNGNAEPNYEDQDLDEAFASMNNDLEFETNETEQFQKDFGH